MRGSFCSRISNDHRRAFVDSVPDELVAVTSHPRSATNMVCLCTRRESYAIFSTGRSTGPKIRRTGVAVRRVLSCMRL